MREKINSVIRVAVVCQFRAVAKTRHINNDHRVHQMALNAQLLKPEVKCLNGGSSYECMAAIKNR